MEMLYELELDGENEKLVATGELLDVGDAVMLDNEVWLVLREAERAAIRGHARYLCRRALQLRVEAEELVAHAKALQLKFTEAREVRSA
ncbi:MAG: hypothetical protein E6G26_08020 [Actinobacteria bacterium]|nr:MAG: hypothetical protein E6G26_08020 [Actinomycetota bacterium]